MLGLWLISVLLVISLPWSNFDATPHWKNVQLVPFAHLSFHPTVLVETALNLLAFVPVGYLAVRSLSHGQQRPVLFALILGACSSVSIEFYQLFCHDRVPATTDVFMNVTGTAIGVWLAFAIDHVFTFWTIYIRRLSSNSSRDEARFPS
jgi:glycopeptide antibiotics resistance protein